MNMSFCVITKYRSFFRKTNHVVRWRYILGINPVEVLVIVLVPETFTTSRIPDISWPLHTDLLQDAAWLQLWLDDMAKAQKLISAEMCAFHTFQVSLWNAQNSWFPLKFVSMWWNAHFTYFKLKCVHFIERPFTRYGNFFWIFSALGRYPPSAVQTYSGDEGNNMMVPCKEVKSVPDATYSWALAETEEDENPKSLSPNKRIVVSPEGKVHNYAMN